MNRWIIREISIIKEGINQLGGILSESTEPLANNRLIPLNRGKEVQEVPKQQPQNEEYDEDLGEDYVEPEEEEEEEELEEEVEEPQPVQVKRVIPKQLNQLQQSQQTQPAKSNRRDFRI